MTKFTQETPSKESLGGAQFFFDLLWHGALQFQEALFQGNPVAVASVGVLSFLLLTLCARFTYSLQSSSQDAKKSSRRRRKVGGASNTASPDSADNVSVSAKQPKKKKAGGQTGASPAATHAVSNTEPQLQGAEAHLHHEDGGGEWLVVTSKKKLKPKKA